MPAAEPVDAAEPLAAADPAGEVLGVGPATPEEGAPAGVLAAAAPARKPCPLPAVLADVLAWPVGAALDLVSPIAGAVLNGGVVLGAVEEPRLAPGGGVIG